jgi:hypothetical protein
MAGHESSFQRARQVAQAAILVSALIGNAAPLEAGNKAGKIRYQDLVPRDLVPGGLAMGGVTSVVGGPTSHRRSREIMALMFEDALSARTDIPLMRVDRVRWAVGPEAYESILDHYELTGDVVAPTLAALRAALVDSIRYVVFARLESDKVVTYKNEEDTDDDPHTDNSEIVKSAFRTVRAEFRVYDLRDGALAWDTRLSGTESAETSAPASGTLFKSWTVAGMLESALSNEEGPPDPQVGDTYRNLPGIFEKFMTKLPKKKKR